MHTKVMRPQYALTYCKHKHKPAGDTRRVEGRKAGHWFCGKKRRQQPLDVLHNPKKIF